MRQESHERRPMTRPPRPARARGYLLIEMMISGVILGLILTATMNVVADERALVVSADNRSKAAALTEDMMALLLADTGPNKDYDTNGSWVTANPDQSLYPGFKRRYWSNDVISAAASQLGSIWELKVEVTYPVGKGATKVVEHSTLRRDRYTPSQ